jgi:flagellar hook protein FlgE
MSFQQGLSGLAAAATALDVIGNNVANASTVGFKRPTPILPMSSPLRWASSAPPGRDRRVVWRDPATVHPGQPDDHQQCLDLAINGGGFFRMSDDGAISYTRNGQFHIDKEGYVINDQKLRLTGYPVSV